jgi:uncharacterized protein YndB with AHSA1/START domain
MPPITSRALPFQENTGFTIDKANNRIVFKRKFSAPCARIFEAWTRPEYVSQWWDPAAQPLKTCEIDLRPGGLFEFVAADIEGVPPFSGAYQVIEPPGLLVFTALGATGTVQLESEQGGTAMTVLITCSSAEHLAQFLNHGVQTGTDHTLNNLVTFAKVKWPS